MDRDAQLPPDWLAGSSDTPASFWICDRAKCLPPVGESLQPASVGINIKRREEMKVMERVQTAASKQASKQGKKRSFDGFAEKVVWWGKRKNLQCKLTTPE